MKDPKTEANRWWRQAESDFALLGEIFNIGKFDTCCFLAQQTAEKALKAYLYAMGEELIFSHSIFKLCELAGKYNNIFLTIRTNVKQLDFYYVEARYPNAIEDSIPAEYFGGTDAGTAIELAKTVLDAVKERLESPESQGD